MASQKMSEEEQSTGLQAIVEGQEKKEVEGKGRGLLMTIRDAAALPVEQWPDARLTALIRFLNVPGARLPDYAAFFTMATKYDLDPFAGQIFMFPTKGGKLKVAVERDGLLKVANDHPDYEGYFSATIYENDTFNCKQNGLPGHEGIEIVHEFGIERGELVAGFCAAFRKGWPAKVIHRSLDEYKHLMHKDNWRDNKPDMIDTRCIAAAHRRLFQLHGLYTSGEIQDSDTHAPLAQGQAATAETLEGLKTRVSKMNGEKVEDPDAAVRADEAAEVEKEKKAGK